MLDVGTGSADLPLALVGYASALGRRVHVTAVDRDPATAAIAAERGGPRARRSDRVRRRASRLPFRPRSFDVVAASLFLHHFDARRGRCGCSARSAALARRVVVVNDLRRHRVPWALHRGSWRALLGRGPMFVHDAPLSVLRGFTADELRRAARAAGAAVARVRRRWPFRLVLDARTTGRRMSAADLLVVGGGPAGARLATLAADGGCAVVLLERARFPRDKVCGEFVSAEGCRVLGRLGVLPALLDAGAARIDTCAVTAGPAAGISSPLPDLGGGARAGLGVSRERLDGLLRARARAAGATVLEGYDAAPHVVSGRIVGATIGRVGTGGGTERLDAAVIVAADGRRSVFAAPDYRAPVRRTRSSAWFGLKVHLRGAGAAIGRRVELHAFDGGYAGLCAIEERRLNACLLVRVGALRACGGDPSRLFAERVLAEPHVRAAVAEATPCSPWHSVGPLRWGVRRAAARGVLCVGDAAGTIDPLCGEGMSHALSAAELVLPHIAAAIEQGGVDPAIEATYRTAWRHAFGAAIRRARVLGWLLERRPLARVVLCSLALGPAPLVPRLVAWTRTGRHGSWMQSGPS